MNRRQLTIACIALAVLLASLWCLERARLAVGFTTFHVGTTPVTSLQLQGATGPEVVVAHGFAGSSQMMLGYGLPLARAGYRVFLFDFLGHGRNPIPMSGDVTSVDGTTRLLVEQVSAVVEAVKTGDTAVALIGHSMATDVLARVAAERDDVGPIVLISAFSQVIDATHPKDALFVTGAWEPGLRRFAVEALRMVDPDAGEGDTVVSEGQRRGAIVAPRADHVSVLHSPAGRQAALDWLNGAYGRDAQVRIYPTGPAILGLIAGLVVLMSQVARNLPAHRSPPGRLRPFQWAILLILPAAIAPLIATSFEPGFIPVLVADYLALHLAIYGVVQLVLLRLYGVRLGRFSWTAFAFLLAACSVIAFVLDRYVANFLPAGPRLWIIAAIAGGAVVFFLADARAAHGQPFLRRVLVHGAFLASVVFAVTLDFEGLFFLLMIAPVIVLFYIVFGSLGHAVSKRCGPAASGVALGAMLALALGVSFPLFSA